MLWQAGKCFWEEHAFINPHLYNKYVGVHKSKEFGKNHKKSC